MDQGTCRIFPHSVRGAVERMSPQSLHIDVNDPVFNETVLPAFARCLLDLRTIGLEMGMRNLRAQERSSENAFLPNVATHDREVQPLLNGKPQLCWAAITEANIGHSKVLGSLSESIPHKAHVTAGKSNFPGNLAA